MSKIYQKFSQLLLVLLFLGLSIQVNAGFFGWLKNVFSNEKIELKNTVNHSALFAPCSPTTGCISGNTFEDYNNNGLDDASESGIQGVVVEIYDASNSLVGNATTDTNGDWQVCSLTDGNEYRVEFIISGTLASWAKPTIVGIDNGSDIQFVTAPDCANFSLSSPADYCEEDPEIMINCFVPGAYNDTNVSNEAVIASLTYSNAGDEDGNVNGTTAEANNPFTEGVIYTPARPTPNVVATFGELGTVWGMVKAETQKKLYTSSYVKGGSSLGPGESTGTIFVTDNPEGTPSTSSYVDLNAIFGAGTAGSNPHPTATSNFYYPEDTTTNIHIGKIGLGDMDISIDESSLYVVNLNDRKLYQIPTSGSLNSSTIQRFDIPTTNLPTVVDGSGTPGTCPPQDVRPFATGVDAQGNVYVGGVCSCESISAGMDAQPNNASYQLTAYVWKFDGTNFTLVLDESLRFNRDQTWNNTTYNTYDTHMDDGSTSNMDWEPWSDLTIAYGTRPDQNEPMLTDIEFDSDHNMLLGFRDRSGDIQSIYTGYTSSGDIYKACKNGSGTWDFESNASCDGITTGGANNEQGPNGGEFFFEDIQGDNIPNSGNGGLLVLPGKDEVVSSATDAVYLDSNGNTIFAPSAGGIQIYDNSTGEIIGAYNFYEADKVNTFNKAAGIGDVEACCTPSPIEIGNYVWFDENINGIQDAGETGINGLVVQIYDATGSLVGQDTTVNGNYFFNQNNIDITGVTVDGSGNATANTAWSGLDYATQYFIVYGDGQFSNNEITVANGNYTITPMANVGANDNIDSDVDGSTLTSGNLGARPDGLPFVDMTTSATGNADHSYDLGLAFPSTTIGNTVWLDENGDGMQDAGEAGIPNIVMELKDDTGAVVATTITDAIGGYIFEGVSPGTYTVSVLSNVPTGLNPTYDEDSGTTSPDMSTSVTVTGEEHLTADFGFNWTPSSDTDTPAMSATGALGDRVWNDANGDGIQDLGELGIENITVNLYSDPDGDGVYNTLVTSTVTDANGNYMFDELAPDGYVVEVLQSDLNTAGFTNPATGDPDGDTDNISEPIIIAPGDVYVNADFGYKNATNLADIGDVVFVDVNADNTFTAGPDIGVPGVSVALIVDTNGDGDWDAGEEVAATTLTSFDGSYLFSDVPAGDYVVVVNDTDNILTGLENTTDPDGGNNDYSGLTLAGTDNLAQDFGYVPTGHASGDGFVGDFIFLDANGSDSYTPGESGLEGVEVQLLDGVTDVVLATTMTNKLGYYFFGNLPADDYKVKIVTTTLPNGLTNSIDAEGANGDDITNSFTLVAGGNILTKDFGYKATTPRTISGTIWEDENADGTFDGTETDRFEGVTVVLKNSDGEIIGVTATLPDGTYSFEGIPDNETYTVDVKEVHNYLEGYWHTTGMDSELDYSTVTLSGADITGVDFGYYKEGASLGNRVWVDTNGDGIQDTNESGVRGAIVMLDIDYDNDGTPEITVSTVTGVDGYYSFDNLLLDEDYNGDGTGTEPDFTIKMTPPAGYASTTDDINSNGNDKEDADDMAGVLGTAVQGRTDVTIQTDPNTELTEATYDFGLVQAGTIGNRVWVDENTDGIQDAGEPGIANVTMELVDGSNNVVANTMTDADGGYLFRNVTPGTYTVRVASGIPTALDNPIYDENNGTSSPDEETSVTLGSGGEHMTADFGYNYVPMADTDAPSSMTVTGALGNRVWNDANGDGVQDAGEAGIPNITVNLYSDPENDGTFTNLVSSTTTDASGNYIFDNLTPDGYVVEVVSAGVGAAGFVTTPTDDPDDDADNISEPVIIAPGDVWLGGDFGYNSSGDPADIGSTVFVDVDADGTYNVANDIPLAGVTVALIDDTNGNGIWDAGEGVVATTETDANGNYLFPDLPADDYVVQVTDSDNIINDLSNNADPDGGNNNYSGVTLGATDDLNENFGYVPFGHTSTKSFIGDLIYLDANGSGGYTAGESGIEGVEVELLDGNTDDVLETTTTNENGLYFFGNLEADDYKVKVNTTTVPSGLTNSVDPDGSAPGDDITNSFALPAGTGDLTKDFGYEATTPHDITGTIWEDTDAEGVLDGTETNRFENVTVELQDANGNIIATTTTDASGNYTFEGVPDGTYTVEVTDVNDVLGNQWHSLGADSENDPVSITVSGANVTDVDFGYYTQPAAVGNYVWEDTDGDGIQDSSEPGIANVVVTLGIDYNNDGTTDVTIATLTDVNGFYDFENLLLDEDYNGDGNGTEPEYTISAATPTGYFITVVDANSNGNDMEDADDPAGVTATATQGARDVSTQSDPNTEILPATFDFGFRPNALPVKLTEFRLAARGCEVDVIWKTESEEDFDYFELEWSGNGQDYKSIYQVKGKGGNTTNIYQYLDPSATAFNYYRLKIVDLDGSTEYSKVENIQLDCDNDKDLVIYPNPVGKDYGILNMKFFSEREETQINIVDMMGRTVKSLSLDVEREWNSLTLDISDLPSGTYNIQVVGDKNSKMLIIQE